MNYIYSVFIKIMNTNPVKMIAEFARFYVIGYIFFEAINYLLGVSLNAPNKIHVTLSLPLAILVFGIVHLALGLKFKKQKNHNTRNYND